MLKLKLQYFAYLMQRADARIRLIGKDSDAGKDWGKEEKRETEDEIVEWHHQLSDMSLGKLWETVKDRETWRAAVRWVAKSWTQLSDWTATEREGEREEQKKEIPVFVEFTCYWEYSGDKWNT